jgi:hypothetical protein
MADEAAAQTEDQVPPPGEPIHLPGPSFLPVLVAFGAMVALVGVVLNWVVCGLGVAVMVVAIVRWISQVRAEIADLPLEHEH